MRNRLAAETSPYLLSHADNPVDWYPWGEEALALARRENKPILLSVGYSACHWCHVMAHESFEDPATAELMNRWFVNIKVDREERPDLDKIYQLAQQLITQRGGGWPLTMFLSPDRPAAVFRRHLFSARVRATDCRLSKTSSSASPPITGTIRRRSSNRPRELAEAFGEIVPRRPPGDVALDTEPLGARPRGPARILRPALRRFRAGAQIPAPREHRALPARWRARHGGTHPDSNGRGRHLRSARRRLRALFGRRLMDHPALREDAVRQRTVARALRRGAAQATGSRCSPALPARPPIGCCARCARPEGGFYSSLDADSEGHEGRFYAWGRSEIEESLTSAEFRGLRAWLRPRPATEFRGTAGISTGTGPSQRRPSPASPSAAALISTRRAQNCWRGAIFASGRRATRKS